MAGSRYQIIRANSAGLLTVIGAVVKLDAACFPLRLAALILKGESFAN
jgi:hypothetical protein